ncbi:MAG TPA: hypothetical protein VD963_11470 [Phycisphaerales bacterium]|nr:hypothetical protein [Phycisphaerales bacterium]
MPAACTQCGRRAILLCVSCGYALAGLRPEQACPECAHPVADSLRPEWVHHAGPAHVRAVASGARLLAIAAGMLAAGMLLSAGARLVELPVPRVFFSLILGLFIIIAPFPGIALCTTPRPRPPHIAESVRLAARGVALAAALLLVLGVILALGGTIVGPLFLIVGLQAWMASIHLALRYLARVSTLVHPCRQSRATWSASGMAMWVAEIGFFLLWAPALVVAVSRGAPPESLYFGVVATLLIPVAFFGGVLAAVPGWRLARACGRVAGQLRSAAE